MTTTEPIKKPRQRILALDILRGITIAGMIMVNNPGSWGAIYAPLKHASWHGLTPTDLVFPFFMFIMGISTYISLRKYNFTYSHDTLVKIVKRTIVIFLIGLAIGWFSRFCYGLARADEALSLGERQQFRYVANSRCDAASGIVLLCRFHYRHYRKACAHTVYYRRYSCRLQCIAAAFQRS